MHDMAAHLDGRGPFSGLQRLGRLELEGGGGAALNCHQNARWRHGNRAGGGVIRTPDGGTVPVTCAVRASRMQKLSVASSMLHGGGNRRGSVFISPVNRLAQSLFVATVAVDRTFKTSKRLEVLSVLPSCRPKTVAPACANRRAIIRRPAKNGPSFKLAADWPYLPTDYGATSSPPQGYRRGMK